MDFSSANFRMSRKREKSDPIPKRDPKNQEKPGAWVCVGFSGFHCDYMVIEAYFTSIFLKIPKGFCQKKLETFAGVLSVESETNQKNQQSKRNELIGSVISSKFHP